MNLRMVRLSVAAILGCSAVVAVPATAMGASTTLPVFAVQRAGLDPGQALALQQAFGLPTIDRAADGSVSYLDEKAFQRVPTLPGSKTTPDEDGNTAVTLLDVNALRALTVLPPTLATSRTVAGLSAAGLLPSSAQPHSDHTTLEVVSRTGAPVVSAALDTATSYSFTLAGLPYEGPGTKIRVAYTGQGTVTQLRYATRQLVQSGVVAVLDLAGGLQRCRSWLGRGGGTYQVTYAYEAPDLATAVTRLMPSFRCTGTGGSGSTASSGQVAYVPAAVDAVPPVISPPPPPRSPSAPGTMSVAGIDVASEGTGECSNLPLTAANIDGFNDEFIGHGVPVSFSWMDEAAWEDDFKDPAFSGHDSNWTDDVDLSYWQGHGSPDGFHFCSNVDDSKLSNTDARWGNDDVEWMSLFTCLVLKGVHNGQAWWQRWGNAFHGLHQINSFHTVSYNRSDHGEKYVHYLMKSSPLKVRSAWAHASIDTQGSDVAYASMGPVGPAGSVTMNDYFHGKGTVGADISHAALTGWWYLRGWS